MRITVKLFAHHRVGRFKESVRDYPADTCVGAALKELRIPEVSPGIVLVNGKPAALDLALRDGDTLSLFPLVSGG